MIGEQVRRLNLPGRRGGLLHRHCRAKSSELALYMLSILPLPSLVFTEQSPLHRLEELLLTFVEHRYVFLPVFFHSHF